ncbi:MAG: FHA domain-containing protein [Spongiibacteraceae bacterium]|nr:FHA domain-containing protein [Spongiibacteraceae bacterium]
MEQGEVALSPSTIVLKPLGEGELIIMRQAMVVGRSRGCDVVINRSYMSRRHAKLIPGKWRLLVEDLGSANGTYVNEEKVSGQIYAKHKDTVRFDTLVYEVKIVVDIDDIAVIDNTKPPRMNNSAIDNKQGEKGRPVTALSVMDVDDVATFNDTPAKGVEKLTLDKKMPNKKIPPTLTVAAKCIEPAVEKKLEKKIVALNAKKSFSGDAGDLTVVSHTRISDTLIKLSAGLAPSVPKKKSKAQARAKTNCAIKGVKSVKNPSKISKSKSSVDRRKAKARSKIRAKSVKRRINKSDAVAVLVGVSSRVKGRAFPFGSCNGASKWEIGRIESCDIMISDTSISRNHAQLVNDNMRWKLTDLMSANGTYVNGVKGLTAYLKSGDTVRFGKQEFIFKVKGSSKVKIRNIRQILPFFALAFFSVIVGAVLFGFFSNSL